MTTPREAAIEAAEYNEYEDSCPNCGGEGVVYDCIDGFCEDAESGCDLCERRCDWCSPAKRTIRDTGDALGQILADALDTDKNGG